MSTGPHTPAQVDALILAAQCLMDALSVDSDGDCILYAPDDGGEPASLVMLREALRAMGKE